MTDARIRTLPNGYRAGNTTALLSLMYDGARIEYSNGTAVRRVDYVPRSEDDPMPWAASDAHTVRYMASELRATPEGR